MNRETQMQEHRRNYKLRHPERVKASKQAWRKKNLDRWVEYTRRWREANPDEAKATVRRWATTHPEAVAQKSRRRRAVLRGVVSEPYDRQEVYASGYGVCCICLDDINSALPPRHPQSFTIQHLVPVSLGGGDVRENVAPAHYACNSAIGNRVVMA